MIRLLSVALLASGLMSASAAAQTAAQRTFVSTSGDDANTASSCAATSPCRSFGAALTVTKAAGEIVPLTSGGYGTVTINKSIKIVAPDGVYVGISAPTGNGISVAAGSSDTVVLRGLTISGLGTGATGIAATQFKALYIENCKVSDFNGIGIKVDANYNGAVYVTDTIVRNNSDTGLFFRRFAVSGDALVTVSVDNTRSENNGQHGFVVTNSTRAAISHSISAGNGANGYYAFANSNFGPAIVNCDACVASDNTGSGFTANAADGGLTAAGVVAIMRVARSSAVGNFTGFQRATPQSYNSATFESLSGSNLVRGNTTTNTSGVITDVTSP